MILRNFKVIFIGKTKHTKKIKLNKEVAQVFKKLQAKLDKHPGQD